MSASRAVQHGVAPDGHWCDYERLPVNADVNQAEDTP